MHADEGEIARTSRVRLSHIELPIKQVGRHFARRSTMEAGFATIVHLGAQHIAAHQPMHPMAIATFTQIA
ncbi:hypothetical protein XGA_3565 [Xanthomonas hortorum ATCC 19865]|nr:hypothetical protein XGA_3565 [Xanthomonas hortorum ATCC 19865]